MAWSWPLVRLLGSEVRVHATFVLLLAFVALSGWQAGGAAGAADNVLFVLALFACVVTHEFGHALMARRYGIATPDITLLPIGGLARLERMPEAPAREIAVALAGPAVSLALWLVLALIAGTAARPGLPDGSGFVADLAAVNLMLALFNLAPAFPMDGGRVLRAALSARWGAARATAVAARAGQAIAALFVVVGLSGGQVMLALIGVFIWVAAASEQGEARQRGALAGLAAHQGAAPATTSVARTASGGTASATNAAPTPRASTKRSRPSTTFLSCAISPASASAPGSGPGMSASLVRAPMARKCAATRDGASCATSPRRADNSNASTQPIATASPCSRRAP